MPSQGTRRVKSSQRHTCEEHDGREAEGEFLERFPMDSLLNSTHPLQNLALPSALRETCAWRYCELSICMHMYLSQAADPIRIDVRR